MQRGGYQMKVQERKNLLNRKALAEALDMSETTLWRVMKSNKAIAKANKLKKCPTHRSYAGGRKYYLASEVQAWIDYVEDFDLKEKS